MKDPTQDQGNNKYPSSWNPGPINRILVFGLPLRETVRRRLKGEHVPQVPEKPEQKEAA